MKKIAQVYHKYMVKNIWLYLLFISIGITILLYLSVNTNVSLIETYIGTYAEDRIIIYEALDYPVEKIHVYKDRTKLLVSYNVYNKEILDDQTTILFVGGDQILYDLKGEITIEIESDYTSLLNLILGVKKRYHVN